MEVLGKVKFIGAEQTVSASFKKRELVVKTDEQYPQFILIEFGQGKCNDYLDKLKANDEVKVSINLRGREWVNPQGETKYFNSIQGWRIDKVEGNSTTQTPMPSAKAFAPAPSIQEEEADDLPF